MLTTFRPYFRIMLKRIVCFAFILAHVAAVFAQPIPGAWSMEDYLPQLAGKRVALVVNHTSLVGKIHLADTLLARGVNIRTIFAPEHGFRGKADAGAHISDTIDHKTGVQVRSLYGKKKKPAAADLDSIDVVVFDIQDIGVRFYTYIHTLFYVAESCAQYHTALMVLDRPNPNGHYTDGPIFDPVYKSFIGITPLPIVHGCTVGELARMYKGECWMLAADSLELTVITCKNYTHDTRYEPPVKPSPNMPDYRSVLLYPGICLFEGTKVSVGRGTAVPFQWFGYPDFPAGDTIFTPMPNEGATNPLYNGKVCNGIYLGQVPVDTLFERRKMDLSWLLYFYHNSLDVKDFFLENGFFDLLTGNRSLRIQIEECMTEKEIRSAWQPGLERYREIRKNYLLYP